MLVTDAHATERIERITAMLRRVSAMGDPAQVQAAFAAELRALHPVDGYVSLSVRGLEPGRYKVTSINAGDGPMNRKDPWRFWRDLPEHEGGILGELMLEPEPRLLHRVDLSQDPVLGPVLGDRRTLMAIPLFDGGEAINWAIVLHRDPAAFDAEMLERFLMRGNLIGRMTKGLVDQRALEEALAERERELQRIAMIQQKLLPDRTPKAAGLDIATSYLTSAESGGDYFDFYEWDDGHFGAIVADVSGHGAGAAVMVAMVQAILHSIPQGAPTSPADVLEYLNAHLMRKNIENSFVTAFCAKFSPDRRVMQYANAGHNRPMLRRGPGGDEGEVTAVDGAASVPLGVIDDPTYTTGSIELDIDDTLILYTDGIVEAFGAPDGPDDKPPMFGVAGLKQSLADCSGRPECVIDSIHAGLYAHTGKRTREDDQTIVAVRVTEQPEPQTADTSARQIAAPGWA